MVRNNIKAVKVICFFFNMLKKLIIVNSKMKSLYQVHEMVNTRLKPDCLVCMT